METKMTAAFQNLIANEKFGGAYYSLTPGHPNEIDDDKYNELIKAHIMFKNMANDSFLVDAGIAKHWPHGRGCYVSEDKQVIVWVGEEDHLRIMCMKKGAILNQVRASRVPSPSPVSTGRPSALRPRCCTPLRAPTP